MDIEAQLNAVLSDPEKLSQIMSLAQSLGLGDGAAAEPAPPPAPEMPDAVASMLSALRDSADDRPTALFQALKPLLQVERQEKIDRAVRAVRVARLATLAMQRLELGQL